MSPEQRSSEQPLGPLCYTIDQFLVLVPVCRRTAYNLIRAGELTTRRVGTRILITRASVEAFLRRDHVTKRRDSQRKNSK